MKVVPGTKCFQKFFKIFLAPKIRSSDRYKYQKKWYFSDLVPVLKVNLNYSKIKNWIFHLLLLNLKSTTFSHLVLVLSPQEIEEKNSYKVFLGNNIGPKTLFLGLKKFWKIYWQHLVPCTTFIIFFNKKT